MSGLGALVRALVVRPARRDVTRFALTILGIAIGVATTAAIQLANASVLSSFAETVDAVAGRATWTVLSDGPGVPVQALERLAWLRRGGVSVVPSVTATAALLPSGEVVDVLGIDPLAEGSARDYEIVGKGAGLDFLAPDAVLVPETLASRLGLRRGDEVTLLASSARHRFRVAGILQPTGVARAASGNILVADIGTVAEAFGKGSRLDRIDLVAPKALEEAGRAALEEEIRASLPPGLGVGPPERRMETVGRMVRALRVNLSALGLVALLVGTYFVYNTVSISVLRRRAEIGAVRALGASRRAVLAVFLAEGAGLGVLGSAIGLGLGFVLARGALLTIGRTATQIYLPSAHPVARLDPGILAFAFAAGTVAAVLSALAPALEASRVAPAESVLQGSIEASRRRTTKPLAIWGTVLLALAAALATRRPVFGLPLFGFAAVFFVVAGISLFAPLVVSTVSRLGRERLPGGAATRIARANLSGSLSRTSVAVAALSTAVSMMVSVAVMVGSFRTTVARWAEQTLRADLYVAPETPGKGPVVGRMPEEVVAAITKVPGVTAVDAYLGFQATRNGVPYSVASGRFDVLAERGDIPLVDGREPRAVFARARREGAAFVSEPYAEKFGVKRGDVVEIPTDRGPVSLPVAGVTVDYANDRGTVLLDRELFQRLYPLDGASTAAVWLAPGVTPEEGRARILRATSDRFSLRVRTTGRIKEAVLVIFDQTFRVTYALEAIALLVALLGVFSTLTALVLERRREIGLLRVVGASRRVVEKAVRMEAAALGGLGTLLGLASGALASVILVKVINRQSFGWTIATHWPWAFLAGAVGLILASTLAAAEGPARHASATDAAQALREE
ncbi:MAG TPA: FtsX-like permease family protein [Thermoanaerobaculia bacterium]|nr:FtsX-like permease family protein [Thermoanaerobaculia bacterium]